MRRMTQLSALLAVGLCAWAAAGCGTDAPTSSASRYVALGDSNASGVGLPTPATGAPENCYRTNSAYPALAAKSLGQTEFASAACSGAGIESFVSIEELYPSGEAPPQFNSLKGNETIVSITIGIIDAGSGEVTGTCLKASSQTATPCADKYVSASGNKLEQAAEALAEPLAEKLEAIHDRAPKAKIFVVGYPRMIPPDGAGCWGKINVSPADAPLFFGWQQAISDTQRRVAAEHDATYVDFFKASEGHDACQPAAKRWTNPNIGVGSAGWPLHPTIAGTTAAAAMFAKSVAAHRLKS